MKKECRQALLEAIDNQTLGEGSVAEGEYLRNMKDARLCPDETARWVEVCYCPSPLEEERMYEATNSSRSRNLYRVVIWSSR